MSDKQTDAELSGQTRYDPCAETDKSEQVAAGYWELLRRIPSFQGTSEKWVASAEFRRQHSLEKGSYAANAPARCALDWMLTPAQRLELAEFQKAQWLLFPPDRICPENEWNFGPIIIEWNWEAHDDWLSESTDKIIRIRPRADSVGRVTSSTTWKDAPGEFKSQFRQTTIGGPPFKEVKLQEIGIILARTGNALIAHEGLSMEEQKRLGRFLFNQGQFFRAIDESYKLAAIPRAVMDEDKLDEILARIKTGILFLPRTGHDWNTKQSFLGTAIQWQKFLAWEAHGKSPYKAAGEFLRADDPRLICHEGKQGELSRSEVQRDIAGSITTAVKAIQSWFPRLYPVRGLFPHSPINEGPELSSEATPTK